MPIDRPDPADAADDAWAGHQQHHPERGRATPHTRPDNSWPQVKRAGSLRTKNTEAATACTDIHEEGERVIFPAMQRIEAADPNGRKPDGPSPPDGLRSPDTVPPPLPDPAERETIRRAYQDLVNAAYADCPQGKSDIPEKMAIVSSWSRGETGQLSHEQGTEAAMPRANRHDESEQADISATPRVEAADPSRRITGPERMYKGEESLYCPVSELKGDEPGTAKRLMESREFTGGTLQGFKDPTGNPDYIDEYKRTYDAVGGPSAWTSPELNMNGMLNQIKRHLYQKTGVDFTVLDLTGASSHQIDEVFKNLDMWKADPAMRPLSKLIILGDDF